MTLENLIKDDAHAAPAQTGEAVFSMLWKDHALVVSVQLDASLVERDWRWNCQRSFEMTIGRGLAELFFIDTNPAVRKYYDRPWANFTGTCLPIALHAESYH